MSEDKAVHLARIEICAAFAELLEECFQSRIPSKNFSEFFVIGLALQFRSNLRAAETLMRAGFDSESWTLLRSLADISIKTKWAARSISNATWIILAAEAGNLNKLKQQNVRHKKIAAAVAAVSARLQKKLAELRKSARFRDRTDNTKVRKLPSTEQMAGECGMLKEYRSWFRWGSDHTHSSHLVLERFMVLDADRNFVQFSLEPTTSEMDSVTHSMLCIAGSYLRRLEKLGWPLNRTKFLAVANKMAKLPRPA